MQHELSNSISGRSFSDLDFCGNRHWIRSFNPIQLFSLHVDVVLLSLLSLLSNIVASFEDRTLSAVLNGGLGPSKIERAAQKKAYL
jgi:hypothetical protein